MTSGKLVSLQVGSPRTINLPDGSTFRTSLYKSSVCEPIWLGTDDLDGNRQADPRYHGGPDRAVCCFPYEHFTEASGFLGQELPGGAFGENFTLSGMLENEVCIGDRYRVGDAVVEISQPRQPCNNLVKRWSNRELLKWMIDHNYTGWYVRVIEEGLVQPGDELLLLERPCPQWTIVELNRVMFRDKSDLQALRELVQLDVLSPDWRAAFQKRL